MNEEYLSAKEIRDALEKAGYSVSPNTLKSWHVKRVIPRPVRSSKGMGGGRGTITKYPPETVQTAINLCRYLEKRRSMDWAILNLWRDGYKVGIRKVLSNLVNDYEEEISYLRNENDDNSFNLSKNALSIVSNSTNPKSKLLRRLRRRVREYFQSLIRLLLVLITGASFNIGEDNAIAIVKATGLQNDKGMKKALKSGLIETDITNFEGLFTPERFRYVLNATSDDELKTVFIQLESWIDHIPDYLQIPINDRANIKPFRDWLAESQILILLLWLSFRKSKLFKLFIKNLQKLFVQKQVL